MLMNNITKSQHGFAMIEVMVTALIIAIGVSGVGVLLMRSIQGTQDNSQKSQAMWVVQDFAGRIRANSPAAKSGDYIGTESGTSCSTEPSPMCAAHNNIASGNCNSSQMAQYDKWITVCGVSASTIDSPTDFLASPSLSSECTLRDARNDCVQYLLDLQWNTKLLTETSDASKRVRTNNYSMILEVN
jgi:type IV pilus modification protein PilV